MLQLLGEKLQLGRTAADAGFAELQNAFGQRISLDVSMDDRTKLGVNSHP